MIPNVGTNNTD
jgi:hypothetical protein